MGCLSGKPRAALLFCLSLSILLATSKCSDDDNGPTSPSRQDTLEVMSVDPAPGSTVAHDQPIAVRAVLRYRFATATAGHVGVTVLAASGGALAYVDAGTLGDVSGREGQISADFTFRLPASAAGGDVTIRWSLIESGASTASAQAGVNYRVAS